MGPFRRYRVAIGAAGLVLALAAASVIGVVDPFDWFTHRSGAAASSGPVGTGGGVAWNDGQRVGVRVAAGGVTASTTFTFAAPPQPLPESQLGDLVDVLVPAVDIVPHGGTVTDAEVAFKIDPARLPAAPSVAPSSVATEGTPTIANAGIEVFDDDLGTWLPIPTTIENSDTLVAHAPHFSIFRAVVAKIGTFAIDIGPKVVQVVQTVVIKPIDLLWNVGVSLVKDLYYSITGQFDPAKFKCEGRNGDFRVAIDDATRQGKFDACVVKAGADRNTVIIKNGLALPFTFKPRGDVAGVAPGLADDGDAVVLARNLLYLLSGEVAISGLEVGSFTLAADAPKDLVIDGELSWVGAGVDLLMALATVLLPKAKAAAVEYRAVLIEVRKRLVVVAAGRTVAISYQETTSILQLVVREMRAGPTVNAQAQFVVDALSCGLRQGKVLTVRSPGEIPQALVELAKGCLAVAAQALTRAGSAAGSALDLLHNVISQTKVLFETGQLAGVSTVNLITGKNVGKVSFRIRRINPALEPFVGKWEHNCGDLNSGLTVNADYTGQWFSRYPTVLTGPDYKYKTQTTKFNLVVDAGKPTFVVTSTDEEGNRVGAKLRATINRADGNLVLTMAGDNAGGAQYVFYRGEGYC